MADYLTYWNPRTVREFEPDTVLYYCGSDQFMKMNVLAGDVMWAVTSAGSGDLRLVARIPVDHVVFSRAQALRLTGGASEWEGADQFVIADPGQCRTPQSIDLTPLALRLVFDGGGRLSEPFSEQHLETMRRLTPESAAVLDRAWDEGIAVTPPRFAWTRDELILALELYLRADRKLLDGSDPRVAALSELLKKLPIHRERHLDPTFRNPDGVAMTLTHFRGIDQPGRGMSGRNRLTSLVWDEFANDPDRLRRMARAIAESVGSEETEHQDAPDEEEEEFAEGRVAFRLHRARERSPQLVAAKKRQALKRTGSLACEICGFDFAGRYGERGQGFIECHHTVAVSDPAHRGATRLEDVALVCSNCHRMVHRWRPWLALPELGQLLTRASLR